MGGLHPVGCASRGGLHPPLQLDITGYAQRAGGTHPTGTLRTPRPFA